MTADAVRRVIIDALARIAPESDASAIPPRGQLREGLDLDSMDFLNFVLALHDRLGVDIPEADYSHLLTLDGAVAYLAAKTAAAAAQS